ncbi:MULTISPECIES: substrate-binding periplasmic protein [unclassified Janthinobacterium]|uniref:substrate-binding periplasmic protein n=1 Tax=unclassified Janthinobacterium TaxID=2610881 RepID=UPI00034CDACF|nr:MULTISPECIES: ABC transporter substrate-binding protein [unclassified Janthinobacterium]MEC5163119.1 polar amino acid transport system substrate-binding protein [Janthinobacterium sp. CG_S6]
MNVAPAGVRAPSWRVCLGLPALALALASGPARAAPIVLAVNQWCPYICELASARRGILVDVITELFAAEGLAVSFVNMPLSRGVQSARGGQIDGVVGILPALAPDLLFPDQPVIDTQFCFFTDAGSAWRFGGFGRKYGGVALGVAHGKVVDARLARAFDKVARVSGEGVTRRMVTMLQLHRLDALLEERRSVEYVLATQHLAPLRMAGCIERKYEYVGFAPGGARARDYAQMFSGGMVKLRDSGRLAQIVAAYGDAGKRQGVSGRHEGAATVQGAVVGPSFRPVMVP